jgi:hypothetical protein
MSRPIAIDLSPALHALLVAVPERSRACSMVVEFKKDWRDRRECGKPARRALARQKELPGYELGCCDDCFAGLVALGDDVFTEAVLDDLYPLVRP